MTTAHDLLIHLSYHLLLLFNSQQNSDIWLAFNLCASTVLNMRYGICLTIIFVGVFSAPINQFAYSVLFCVSFFCCLGFFFCFRPRYRECLLLKKDETKTTFGVRTPLSCKTSLISSSCFYFFFACFSFY